MKWACKIVNVFCTLQLCLDPFTLGCHKTVTAQRLYCICQSWVLKSTLLATAPDALQIQVLASQQNDSSIIIFLYREILARNLLRLCQSQVSNFPSLRDRRHIYKPYINSHYYYRGKKHFLFCYQLQLTCDLLQVMMMQLWLVLC